MKLALVHDHLNQDGGAERVLDKLHGIYPESPIYSLVYDNEIMPPHYEGKNIHTSFIQRLPLGVKKFEWYLPFMPAATETHDLRNYNVILSSASAFAKGVLTHPDALHICYCHTPTRYLWTDPIDYVKNLRHGFLVKNSLPMVLTRLRQWDRMAADRVNIFVANSLEVQKRIKKFYKKDSFVIYPPVATSKFKIRSNPDNYFLAGGRLVPYKRFDLLVKTFNRLGMNLKIFGDGPLFNELQKMAGPKVEFLGRVTEETKIELFEKCLAFINPQVEDFGITTVEAMAAGRPVIAFGQGGARETIVDGQTGVFFHEQEWETLADTIIRFKPENFKSQTIRDHALQFDEEVFKEKMVALVERAWERFTNRD
jgi:glycosyltransferase involved in cell wall biosynthesis